MDDWVRYRIRGYETRTRLARLADWLLVSSILLLSLAIAWLMR